MLRDEGIFWARCWHPERSSTFWNIKVIICFIFATSASRLSTSLVGEVMKKRFCYFFLDLDLVFIGLLIGSLDETILSSQGKRYEHAWPWSHHKVKNIWLNVKMLCTMWSSFLLIFFSFFFFLVIKGVKDDKRTIFVNTERDFIFPLKK